MASVIDDVLETRITERIGLDEDARRETFTSTSSRSHKNNQNDRLSPLSRDHRFAVRQSATTIPTRPIQPMALRTGMRVDITQHPATGKVSYFKLERTDDLHQGDGDRHAERDDSGCRLGRCGALVACLCADVAFVREKRRSRRWRVVGQLGVHPAGRDHRLRLWLRMDRPASSAPVSNYGAPGQARIIALPDQRPLVV